MPLRLALVGCGGMGLRHLHGMAQAARTFGSITVAAVCDRHQASAQHVASEAERLTGARPAVFTDFSEMLDKADGLDGLDIVTDTRMHHAFALEALDAGLHVITEKPMGLTLRVCRQMAEAARASGKTLAVAENYRRDPMNRLARALIDGGAIGTPYFLVDVGVGGGWDLLHNTGWRALKSRGGSLVLERGVHNGDLFLYFMGDVDTVYAATGVFQKRRRRGKRRGGVLQMYQHRVEDTFAGEDEITIDAEDTAMAVVKFKSGAHGQLTMSDASHGHEINISTLHGSEGTLLLPPSRSGVGPKIKFAGREAPVAGDDLLALAPQWELDDITAALWGERRMASYEMEGFEIDRKVIAVELQDFVEAVEQGRPPEVGAEVGMKALALTYGMLESGQLGRPVTLDEVIDGRVAGYQADINSELEG